MRGIPRMQRCVEAIILSVAVGLTELRIVSQLTQGTMTQEWTPSSV